MRIDRHTDALYGDMRGRYGAAAARANGYRYEAYFRREQRVLHKLMDPRAAVVVDACCGSGLMLLPLVGPSRLVFGVEFNAEACRAAVANGFPVVRGDAYRLPLAPCSVDEVTNCQFFNQQDAAGVAAFVNEAARVLVPGGRLILVWRNGAAAIHRVAHTLLTGLDRLRGMNEFPQRTHTFADLDTCLEAAGLAVSHREVTCPPLNWRSVHIDSLAARLLGASCVVVACKPE